MQEKVNKWLESGCDYDEGVNLLASFPAHKQMAKIIAGRPHRYTEKLRYELLKCASADSGATSLETIKLAGSTPQPINNSTIQPLNKSTTQQLNPSTQKQLPPEVEHVIKLHADAYKTRAILHSAMAELPSENTEGLIKKRKEFSDQIAECSKVIDAMHKAKDEYYVNGTIPDIKAITANNAESSNPPDLPDDLQNLKDLKKQIQSLLSKDQHMLDYQQTKKGNNLNPMPKGPKRTKIELRMKSRTEALETIERKLHQTT
jgi:hypothetical protein